jgi:hypothetical protein
METRRGNFEMKSREVRSLSDEGRTMTVRTTLDNERARRSCKSFGRPEEVEMETDTTEGNQPDRGRFRTTASMQMRGDAGSVRSTGTLHNTGLECVPQPPTFPRYERTTAAGIA